MSCRIVRGALARGALGSSPKGESGGGAADVRGIAGAVADGVAGREVGPAHAVAKNRAAMTAARKALIPLLCRAPRSPVATDAAEPVARYVGYGKP